MYRRMSTPTIGKGGQRKMGTAPYFSKENRELSPFSAVPLRDYLRGKVLMTPTASQNSVIFSSPAGITCRTLRPKAFREEGYS